MFTVGIDLGTTASVVAYIDDEGKPSIIKIDDNVTTPSVVNYSEDLAVVGREAISEADSDNTVFSVKRAMGTNEKFCEKTPIEVSADILFYLKKQAEKNLGRKIDAAVITVPANFSDVQRSATKHAASIAGIKVLRLINEPTAAAIAFGLDKQNDGIFAVYDFGGGTFDFSILRLINGVFQVLATGGDNYLGGDDIDDAILRHNFQMHGLDFDQISENEKISGILIAKFLKEHLQDSPLIRKNYIYKGKNYEFELSQEILQKVSSKLIQKSLKIADRVISDSGKSCADLDGIVMVGGVTRLKLVREEACKHFQITIFSDINPEEAVALGAALYADSISRKSNRMLLIDVISLTLGIETFGGGVDKIIHRNSPIPITEKREYTTYQDGQSGIKIHVLQGEESIANECRSLAHFELTGIPPMPAGVPRLIVEFSVDVNGLLSVKAYEKYSKIQQAIVVDPSAGLSNKEITAILKRASSSL